MNAFDEFIMSDAFFPVIVVLLVLLVAVFIIITINNKKKYGPFKNIKNIEKPEIDYSSEIHIVDDLSPAEEISDDEFDTILNTVVSSEEAVEKNSNATKSENIIVEEPKIETQPTENEYKDLNDLNKMAWTAFDNIQTEEFPEKTEQKNIEVSNKVDTNSQDNDKFMADVHEFPDFSTIEKIDKKEEHKSSRIEEDVLDAANKYIESIMSNNK